VSVSHISGRLKAVMDLFFFFLNITCPVGEQIA